MAEFKISRLRYTWKNQWSSATSYNRDDIVRVGGKTFVCIEQHTSSSAFTTDDSKWVKMTDGSRWRDTWTTATNYKVGDIVFNSGIVYYCVTEHTSSSFATNYSNWIIYNEGTDWNYTWQPSTVYNVGDLVKYNGIVYKCVSNHTSSTESNGLEVGNFDNIEDSTLELWEVYHEGIEYKGNWNNAVRYRKNDVVKFGGSLWKCTVGHTSGDDSSLNFNDDYFTLFLKGNQYVGEWDETVSYSLGDIVRYGGYLYVSIKNDTNEIPSTETQAWTLITKNYNFRDDWYFNQDYKTGDVVRHGGSLYVAVADVFGESISSTYIDVTVGGASSGDSGNKFYFDGVYKPTLELTVGNTYIFNQTTLSNVYFPNTVGTTVNSHPLAFSSSSIDGIHDGGTSYLIDVVYKLNELEVTQSEYIENFAVADTRTVTITISKGTPTPLYYWGYNEELMGSSLTIVENVNGVDPDTSNDWIVLNYGEEWAGGWQTNVDYHVGSLVTFENYTYKCIIDHHSNAEENYPGNGNGFNYWSIYLIGDENNALAAKGDILSFGLKKDGSSLGEIAVNIGELDQQLTIGANSTLEYVTHGSIRKFYYVSEQGIDAPGRGDNPGKPFRTIRYATEFVEENRLASETTGVTIFVRTGTYDEVLPIIVPAYTSIVGEELRSVTVRAKQPIDALAVDITYTELILNRLKDLIPDVIINNEVIPSSGNVIPQNTNFAAGSTAATQDIENLIDDIIQYLDYYLNSTGTEPTLSGSNTAVTTTGYTNTVSILEANKEFLAAEASAYITTNYPTYVFDSESCKRDARRYIDAFKYDIIYTGNYKSLLAARYYRNAVLGSETEDMFYVRNSTGIRNMTLKGLNGDLNPPLVNELYRRPTGGSFVSLDPGWGPDDERTWITTRSCYVQNCTTFGYASVGQKIDGSLHNGGNKSIVSNDFTQVISDGIGAWVLNNGRAELVSVFTYYAQIGMFAEDGGIIRATNGNSSYGDFGALADGNDPTETPRYGYVNNRTTQATVVSAFAGEINDEILLLEFGNAGQNYTEANYTFVGSGTGAVTIQEEFRDNAVFEMQVRNPVDDPNASEGGLGYILSSGNAQTGDTVSINLSSNDEHEESELLGLRIVLTSGGGTGQYGIVNSYNPTTKYLTVIRESDGQPGWDHVIPGTPSQTLLTTNAVYRFEPRITFSAPPYSTETVTLGITSQSSADVVYGETSGTYNNIVGSVGTGTTIEIVAETAIWNVVKTGREYIVTLVSGGAGYADEQTVTIIGSAVGGVDDENDITITVKSISDDSTNSIVSFEYTGIAASGKFVVTPSASDAAPSSLDGQTWETGTLPSSGNWKSIASGNNKFVAIKYGSNSSASSTDGYNWTSGTLPSSKNWNAVTFGQGIFVAVAGDADAGAFSTDGITWTATTLPDIGDSTFNEWVDIAYGKGKFVAIANSGNFAAVGTYNSLSGTISWTAQIMDVIADSSVKDWTSIAYGNQRFVAISSTGNAGYSFDGNTWYPATMPTQDGSTPHRWTKIKYGQGVFFAVGDTGSRDVEGDVTTGPTTFAATSYDGIVWTSRSLPVSLSWSSVAFGNPDITLGDSTLSNSKPTWIAISSDSTVSAARIYTGARAIGRAIVEAGAITSIRIWEPGSGYTTPPTYTITDPNNTAEAYIDPRLGDGVLAQPSWTNRGNNYKTSSTSVTVLGDGFADVIPNGVFVTISGLELLPGPGTQFRFRGETDYYTVATIELESTESDGTLTAVFRISPSIDYNYNLEHSSQVEIRERYSQVRITGHDFLDVGTGSFTETNYPELYSTGNYVNAPENEVVELNGGRVFYTSTDQNGNFRTGELFAVEQATGIVTISADFFDLQGLTELALGGVRLGGSGAVVREFSTDPLFTADSNNIVPTQRAIKSYLALRLSIGGSDLAIPSFIAGQVLVGPSRITTTTGATITVPTKMDISGNKAGINGSMLAQMMFHGSFNVR